MSTSKGDATKAGRLLHSKNRDVRSIAGSDLAQAKKHQRKTRRKSRRR